MTEPSRAVFLSYASQDSEAAKRICEALRATGIEVWFDQSELRGGDLWDASIRKQIRTCGLFVPIISNNTRARMEGYFRLEWKLAVDRSYLISESKAFLVPVVIDNISEDDEHVPERFREVQWTKLPAGQVPPAFLKRVVCLLSEESAGAPKMGPPIGTRPGRALRLRSLWLGAVVLLGAGLTYLLIERPKISSHLTAPQPVTTEQAGPRAAMPPVTAFAPPPHSIAVLPFVNMSGDVSQEYFSDGLTEELLNSLARFPELQVAARTSAFSFKGKDADVATIAHKLNVGAVLEGSVRRSAHTLRITAQLIDAVTGFHLWSQTFDRNLGDVLKLQTDIANSVANALKVTLLADTAGTIGLGATANPAAFDAYLRGKRSARVALDPSRAQTAISAYTEAIRLDPNYALAFAERSVELINYARFDARGPAIRESSEKALADARKAVSLAPDLAEAYLALAVVLNQGFLEFAKASSVLERALSLAPGNARVLSSYSRNAAEMGHAVAAINTGRRAIALDPLNFVVYRTVGIALFSARQYADALAAFRTGLALQSDYVRFHALIGETQYEMGNLEAARSSCEIASADVMGQICLAMTYHHIGKHTEASAMLERVQSSLGDSGAYDYATIYAQWGDLAKALEWLETAWRLRDPSLSDLKTDPDLDPLRKESRFRAVERELNFPN